MSKSDSLLCVQNISIKLGGHTLCQSLDMEIRAGEYWAVLGKNGAGKTTLLHTLLGLRSADTGQVLLQNRDIRHLTRKQVAKQAGLLLQDVYDAFPGSVMETVLIGRHPHLGAWQWESEHDLQLAHQALKEVDLQGFEQREVSTLSGGERRRLYLATLLVQQPQLYFLDEPVNHLDLHHQHHVLQLLDTRRRQEDSAVMLVLHDVNLAARYCDHVLMIFDDGETRSGKSEELLSPAILSELYQHGIKEIRDGENKYFVSV